MLPGINFQIAAINNYNNNNFINMLKKIIYIFLLIIFISFPFLTVYALEPGQLGNPLKYDSFVKILLAITAWVANIAIYVAVLMIIIGGFQFMFAHGSEDSVTKAKRTIYWAILGLIIAMLSKSLLMKLLEVLGADPSILQ